MTRALALGVVLAACTQSGEGPARIAWDRDTCRGCGMALSDHHFAVQVRGGPKNSLEKFDDLGCALKWLAKQPWANEPSTHVWVTSTVDGAWLDARVAHYVDGQHSPMAYGWGAVAATEKGIGFDELKVRLAGSTP